MIPYTCTTPPDSVVAYFTHIIHESTPKYMTESESLDRSFEIITSRQSISILL
jgi:hypothetical protein